MEAITACSVNRTRLPRTKISTFRCASSGATPSFRAPPRNILQHLRQCHQRVVAPVLIAVSRFVLAEAFVRVDENVDIEKCEAVHRRSWRSWRSNFQPREILVRTPRKLFDLRRVRLGIRSPPSWARYSRTDRFTLVPRASARRRAERITSSSIESVTLYTFITCARKHCQFVQRDYKQATAASHSFGSHWIIPANIGHRLQFELRKIGLARARAIRGGGSHA